MRLFAAIEEADGALETGDFVAVHSLVTILKEKCCTFSGKISKIRGENQGKRAR